MSGTPFTAPRAENRRSWLYRIRPSATHPPFRRIDDGLIRTAPFHEADASAEPAALEPAAVSGRPTDFVDGLVTIGGNGDAGGAPRHCIHIYRANRPMTDRVFYDADGELLIVPQQGGCCLPPSSA